jgi:hypothetical protein
MKFLLIATCSLFLLGWFSSVALVGYLSDSIDAGTFLIDESTVTWNHLGFACCFTCFPMIVFIFEKLFFSALDDSRRKQSSLIILIGGLIGALSGILIRLVFFVRTLLQPSTAQELISSPSFSINELALNSWILVGGMSGIIATAMVVSVVNFMLLKPEESTKEIQGDT